MFYFLLNFIVKGNTVVYDKEGHIMGGGITGRQVSNNIIRNELTHIVNKAVY